MVEQDKKIDEIKSVKPQKRMRINPPDRDAHERIKDFDEVNEGFTDELAILEAERCLDCKDPGCVKGCPVDIDIPKFIMQIKSNKVEDAYDTILKSHAFPSITGRVCPQEKQCEALCVYNKMGRAVNIGKLERYVGDKIRAKKTKKNQEQHADKKFTHSVGIVGSGPAAMALAADLLKADIKPVVYEAFDKLGGVLVYGIPEFRLPKSIVKDEIENLIDLGMEINYGTIVGKSISFEELLKRHDYLFIAGGAGLPRLMNVPGEDLNHVLTANEFLTRVNLLNANRSDYKTPMPLGETVAVIGGGNVAMDAARVARRYYKSVDLYYRRNIENMSARVEEIDHAVEEGINMHFGYSPVEIKEGEIVFTKNGEESTQKADVVVIAIGTEPNKLINYDKENIKTQNGLVLVDDNLMTNNPRIYAGGDVVTGAATVILAYQSGRIAAKNIIKNLKER